MQNPAFRKRKSGSQLASLDSPTFVVGYSDARNAE